MTIDTKQIKSCKRKKDEKNMNLTEYISVDSIATTDDKNHDEILDKVANTSSTVQEKFAEAMTHLTVAVLKGKDIMDLSWMEGQYSPGALKLNGEKVVVSFAGDSQNGTLSLTQRISSGIGEPDFDAFMATYGQVCFYAHIHMAVFVAEFRKKFPGIQATCEITIPVDAKQTSNGAAEKA